MISARRLSIGLDLRALEDGFKAHFGRGTGRYASQLAKHLPNLTKEPRFECCRIVPISSTQLGAGKFEQWFYQCMPLGRTTIEQQVLLARRIKRLGLDLFHFFSHVDAPARCSFPYVITVLDLIPLKFADLYKADKPNWRFKFARFLELEAIKKALGIIAISEATKADLVEILGVDPEKVVVTPLAASSAFQPRSLSTDKLDDQMKRAREMFELSPEKPIILYVGGIDARKNILFLLDSFSQLVDSWDDGQKPVLLMAGNYRNDNHYLRLTQAISNKKLAGNVKLLGFVDDELLSKLYWSADVTVFPSLYEGFGLPVLESMACGVPVVAANNSSIPEVTGRSGAVLIDGFNRDEWAASLEQVIKSKSTQVRLAEQGALRAKEFSWEKTAAKTIEAYSYFSGAPVVSGSNKLNRQSAASR